MQDRGEAMTVGDSMATLNHGRLAQAGTPHGICRIPHNNFVAAIVALATIKPLSGRSENGRLWTLRNALNCR
jgi:ABC-type sugar transport system ATPase subunit